MNAAMTLAIVALMAGPWRDYAVYQPEVDRVFINDAQAQPLKYNHDSSLAWFGDRWFCLWNANKLPKEGSPGQLNYMSTSRDGRTWSTPEPAFSSSKAAENPLPCPTGTQWQPNLTVVESELWALWDQNSDDEHRGCYFSRLKDPNGKWINRRLLWDGEPRCEVDGQRWRAFPTQNPIRLRCGRVLAPVTMIGDRAVDAPTELSGWQAAEKRNSVLWTDDGGRTWHLSPGTVQPGRSWAQWEPTVWQLDDGTVMMFARNNDFRRRDRGGVPPSRMLLWSKSLDRGETWTSHRYVPLETVCSRMHVIRAGGDRFMMVHNDAPADQFVSDRRNLALFFNRGGGFDFVAGPGLTGSEPVVAYPQMWIHQGHLSICYSQGRRYRSIKVAHVHPLPAPNQHYVFPRSTPPPSARPRRVGDGMRFDGGQYVTSRAVPDPKGGPVSLAAWVRDTASGVLLDTRSTQPHGGLLWAINNRRCLVYVGNTQGNIVSSLPVDPDRWNYIGATIDPGGGEVVFRVNDQSETIPLATPLPHPLRGDTARIGYKRFGGSRVPGLCGHVRTLWYFAEAFDASAYQALRAGRAAHLERDESAADEAPSFTGRPLLHFVPSNSEVLARDFIIPEGPTAGVVVERVQEATYLRFNPLGSAGVDLDDNERAAGDAVQMRFRFRLISPTEDITDVGRCTVVTVGDTEHPVRLRIEGTKASVHVGDRVVTAGEVQTDAWTEVDLYTADDRTEIRLSDGPAAVVKHAPQANWIYLGEGYHDDAPPANNAFQIDLTSLRSRVIRHESPAGRSR